MLFDFHNMDHHDVDQSIKSIKQIKKVFKLVEWILLAIINMLYLYGNWWILKINILNNYFFLTFHGEDVDMGGKCSVTAAAVSEY